MAGAEPHPARAARALGALPLVAMHDEVDIGVGCVSGPVLMEIFEEDLPVWWQTMHLEVPNGKRQGVIDAHERRRVGLQVLGKPVRKIPAAPVLSRARWGQHLLRRGGRRRTVDTKVLQAGIRRLGAGVVDSEVVVEGRRGK